MTGQRWDVKDPRSGVLVAQLKGTAFQRRQAQRAAELLATVLGYQLSLTLTTGPQTNPTLVHHGKARGAHFHLTSTAGAPIADLYVLKGALAERVAQAIADDLKVGIVVTRNIVGGDHHQRMTAAAPRPRANQRRQKYDWTRAGMVRGSKWVDARDCPQANPKGRNNQSDERLTPTQVLVVGPGGAVRAKVERVNIYQPGQHPPGKPIRKDLTLVELVTRHGSRYYGVGAAWIGPDLRGHVTGWPAGFEEIAAWPRPNPKRRKPVAGSGVRMVRGLSPLAQRLSAHHERARVLTEAWARGMAQGGHEVTPDAYAEVYATALARAKREASSSKNPSARPRSRRTRQRAGHSTRRRSARRGGGQVRRTAHANPRERDLVRARRTYRRLNEVEPGTVTTVRAAQAVPRVGVQVGELVSFVYQSDKYDGKTKLYEHKTRRPRPVLATDPGGKDVHIVGGRMRWTPDGAVN